MDFRTMISLRVSGKFPVGSPRTLQRISVFSSSIPNGKPKKMGDEKGKEWEIRWRNRMGGSAPEERDRSDPPGEINRDFGQRGFNRTAFWERCLQSLCSSGSLTPIWKAEA